MATNDFLSGPVFTGRSGPNVVPPSRYLLPSSDEGLADDARELLRYHPVQYVLLSRYTGGPDSGRFNRCPTCEQWSSCDVRTLVEQGQLEEAKHLHEEREWPANTGAARTRFRGMTVDYSHVTWQCGD